MGCDKDVNERTIQNQKREPHTMMGKKQFYEIPFKNVESGVQELTAPIFPLDLSKVLRLPGKSEAR